MSVLRGISIISLVKDLETFLFEFILRFETEKMSKMSNNYQAQQHMRRASMYQVTSQKEEDKSNVYFHLQISNIKQSINLLLDACDEAPSICAQLLIISSIILVVVTLPFSLCLVIKVVHCWYWSRIHGQWWCGEEEVRFSMQGIRVS